MLLRLGGAVGLVLIIIGWILHQKPEYFTTVMFACGAGITVLGILAFISRH